MTRSMYPEEVHMCGFFEQQLPMLHGKTFWKLRGIFDMVSLRKVKLSPPATYKDEGVT